LYKYIVSKYLLDENNNVFVGFWDYVLVETCGIEPQS